MEYETYSGNPVIVLSEFDGERKEGEITQKFLSEGLLINNTLIQIESHDGDKAKISLYTTKNILSTGIRSPKLSDIKRWADGDVTCQHDTLVQLSNTSKHPDLKISNFPEIKLFPRSNY